MPREPKRLHFVMKMIFICIWKYQMCNNLIQIVLVTGFSYFIFMCSKDTIPSWHWSIQSVALYMQVNIRCFPFVHRLEVQTCQILILPHISCCHYVNKTAWQEIHLYLLCQKWVERFVTWCVFCCQIVTTYCYWVMWWRYGYSVGLAIKRLQDRLPVRHCCATTSGQLFTPLYLSPSSMSWWYWCKNQGYNSRLWKRCGLPSMTLTDVSSLLAQDQRNGDEHGTRMSQFDLS